MILPVWMLVGFAAWTLLLLPATVGVNRCSRILTGRAAIREFRADQIEGADWYKPACGHTQTPSSISRFLAQLFSGCTLAMWAAPWLMRWQSRFWLPASCNPWCTYASDQHDDIRALRLLLRADRQFSLVNWNPAEQASGIA